MAPGKLLLGFHEFPVWRVHLGLFSEASKLLVVSGVISGLPGASLSDSNEVRGGESRDLGWQHGAKIPFDALRNLVNWPTEVEVGSILRAFTWFSAVVSWGVLNHRQGGSRKLYISYSRKPLDYVLKHYIWISFFCMQYLLKLCTDTYLNGYTLMDASVLSGSSSLGQSVELRFSNGKMVTHLGTWVKSFFHFWSSSGLGCVFFWKKCM